MRGDFSAWNKDRSQNFRGTLHQQGRVLLDRDWNAQTEVIGEWQETAGRDAFGAGVAAVPAEVSASFKVTKAEKITTAPAHVKIGLKKGRVWADGLLAELFDDNPKPNAIAWPDTDAVRTATYLNPPPGNVGELPNNHRDVVILETWLQELSPFQVPDLLIEPALGGVDTTERVQTAYRFRLYRMAAGETCDSIIPKLKDDFNLKGKLTAKLADMTETGGDCPVVESGGYTGFEHRLYRIEIADTDPTKKVGSYFKWSQFNGGLVGRGVFDAAAKKVEIRANQNAIAHCGISNFYLEALEFDTMLGCWSVIYGVNNVTLNADNTLTLPAAASNVFTGAVPPKTSGGKEKLHFFRLWNGIERVNNFTAAAGTDLPDKVGIKLKFDAEGAGKYTASDYWTFEVRVGQGVDATTPPLVDNKAPQGIFYHRVPLAELNWKTDNVVDGDDIEDCRRIFQPLTKLKTCCTYRVGDGVSSHGDFTKIQDAINALPKAGGEVCILPGTYVENIVLEPPRNKRVILKGCGKRTIIRAANNDAKLPEDNPKYNAVIYVRYGQGITIESLAVEAHPEGVGIYLEGEEKTANDTNSEKYLQDISMSGLYVHAAKNNAIKGFSAQSLTLCRSVVYIDDEQTRKPAVYLEGDDMLIEQNEIRVLPDRLQKPTATGNAASNTALTSSIFEDPHPGATNDPELLAQFPAQEAAGGLQIGGGSERVRVINNLIVNGTGNGITLGRIDLKKDQEEVPNRDPFEPKDQREDCCNPDDGFEDDDEVNEDGYSAIAGPPLYDILIKFNRIYNMGRNGIGVASFFSLGNEPGIDDVKINDFVAAGGLIFVSKLVIVENRIERCVNIPLQDIPSKMSYLMGFGGIALAFVDTLVVRDNFILDNCTDCRYPICGIFALAVIGADISQNEITEHIPQHYEDLSSEVVKHGPRGGIWIFIALGQMDVFGSQNYKRFGAANILRNTTGAYAAKIHENVVSTPLGRSLTLTVFGDASILGNRFTSYGLVPIDIIKLVMSLLTKRSGLDMSMVLQLLSLVAGNVLIFDLGSFVALKEYRRMQGTKTTDFPQTSDNPNADGTIRVNPGFAAYNTNLQNAARLMNMFTQAGMINFSDNHCKLNPKNTETLFALSSVFIAGLADIGFHSNQTSCNIPDSILITNAMLLGGTVRATANWLKESFIRVAYSALTFGFLNATTDNESVHCLNISGIQFIKRHNLILSAILGGVTGDIMDPERSNKLEDLCESQRGLSRILLQMYVAIMKDQDDETNKEVATFMSRGGGG